MALIMRSGIAILCVLFGLLYLTDNSTCLPAKTEAVNSTDLEQPPLVFPDDNKKYKIIAKNTTIITSLSHNKTESDDLRNFTAIDEEDDFEHKVVPLIHDQPELKTNPKLQIEILQIPGASVQKDTYVSPHPRLYSSVGHWLVIAVSAILIMMFVVYSGIFVWRRYGIFRYGNRQILINEEGN